MSGESTREFRAGLFYVAVGLGFAGLASTYPMGTLARIGPGYFPLCLALVLIAIGLYVMYAARRSETEKKETIARSNGNLRAAIFVLAAVIAFGLLIRPAGLIVSVITLVTISSLAVPGYGFIRALIAGGVLAALAATIFNLGLGLPLDLLPPALGFSL